MSLRHRVSAIRRAKRGDHGHSYYNGFPKCARRFRSLSETTLKRFVEPTLVSAFGAVVTFFNVPLGVFIAIAGGCMGMSSVLFQVNVKRDMLDMNDQLVEGQLRAERVRTFRGGL